VERDDLLAENGRGRKRCERGVGQIREKGDYTQLAATAMGFQVHESEKSGDVGEGGKEVRRGLPFTPTEGKSPPAKAAGKGTVKFRRKRTERFHLSAPFRLKEETLDN